MQQLNGNSKNHYDYNATESSASSEQISIVFMYFDEIKKI